MVESAESSDDDEPAPKSSKGKSAKAALEEAGNSGLDSDASESE